jgi:hypothetical protein
MYRKATILQHCNPANNPPMITLRTEQQNRTEQNRTEQNRTEQNRTEQNRTEQDRTGQDRKSGN